MSELPKGWVSTTVGDVSQAIQYGYTASGLEREADARMLRITDIQNGIVDWTRVPFCAISPEEAKKFSLKAGDLVFARTGGTVGKSFLIRHPPENAVFASYLIRISVFPAISPVYLYWFFQSLSYWEQIGFKKGGLQGNVNAQMLATVSFSLPPLAEQHRIVAKIEELFSELDASEQSLTRARAQLGIYRQSLLKAAFQGTLTADWRAANPDKLETPEALLARIRKEREDRYRQALDDWQTALSEWRAKGEKGSKPKKPSRPEPISDVTASNRNDFTGWPTFELGDVLRVTSGQALTSSEMKDGVCAVYGGNGITGFHNEWNIEEPTLILGRVGAKCGVAHITRPNSWITDNALLVVPLVKSFDRRFFRSLLEFLDLNRLGSSTGQPVISGSKIYHVQILLPQHSEQMEIADRLESGLSAVDHFAAELEAISFKITALRQSILKKAFAGELVPQDPTDEPAAALLARIRAEAPALSPRRKKSA